MYLRKQLVLVFVLVVANATVSRAVQYSFLPVTATGTYTSQFTSSYGNGVINVTDAFPTSGPGLDENLNNLIYPSDFSTLFPGTGQVQGHLTQTLYGNTSTVTIDLSNYNLTSSTVFGIWNITDEVSAPAGGNFVYQLAMLDSSSNTLPLTSLGYYGNADNPLQVGRHQLDLDTSTGELYPGIVINGGNGIHTDAIFWDQIPTGTTQIVVSADLPVYGGNNPYGDGVGYYFAEVVPEPASLTLLAAGATLLLFSVRRKSSD